MRAFINIISFCALLLLIMPPTINGCIGTFIVILLGTALMLWKKPWRRHCKTSKIAILVAILCSIYLGYRFYIRWTSADIFPLITAILPIPNSICMALINFATIFGSVFAVFACVSLFNLTQMCISISDSKKLLERNLWCCILMAGTTVMLSQILARTEIMSMGYFKFFCAVLIVSSLSMCVYSLCDHLVVSLALCTGFFMVISTVNVYVYLFRGRLFDPVDIFSAGTAIHVLNNYDITSSLPLIVVSWSGWLALLLNIARSTPKERIPLSVKKRAVSAVSCISIVGLLFSYASNLPPHRWKNQGATNHGYILNYISRIQEIHINEPSGYDPDEIHALSDLYAGSEVSGENEAAPHIVVIMDEAFSDLSVLGQLKTNKEVLPFISSLHENVISGYALTSVHGGNTANSEYEFLTGNSMAWLLPNAVPYQQYVNAPSYSMISYLKENYQYRCIAMHPYRSSGWNRTVVYPNFGFDEWYFEEAFPQQHYIRTYISDLEMFQTIIDTFEERKEEPLFLFGVTMQNHGSYIYEGEDFVPEISLREYDSNYPDVEQYLSLIHETDKAVEHLISYFENFEDDVVIVFFGDHQPKISEEFYSDLGGDLSKSLDDQQKQYLVPFFIWANYDIAEQDIGVTSLNFLSSYVYEAVGLPLPPYNQFLSELETLIPSINAFGFYSATSQCYLPFDMASDEERMWLRLYEQLQYNNIFDKKNHSNVLFPVLSQ